MIIYQFNGELLALESGNDYFISPGGIYASFKGNILYCSHKSLYFAICYKEVIALPFPSFSFLLLPHLFPQIFKPQSLEPFMTALSSSFPISNKAYRKSLIYKSLICHCIVMEKNNSCF